MFVVDKFSIDCSENITDDIFIRIYLDTEGDTYTSALNRYFRNELTIKKPWIGWVDTNHKQFELRRTRLGILKDGISMFEIHGKLNESSRELHIEIKPIRYGLLGFLWLIAFLFIPVFTFFNDLYGWVILSCVIILEILLVILDFRKTEESFKDYLMQVMNVHSK